MERKDDRVGASTKSEGGGRNDRRALDVQHLCGYLGHVDVQCWEFG